MNITDISKGELGINLSKKPRYKSSVALDTLGRPYYKRFSFNKIFTIINPTNKNVASVRKYHEKEVRRKIRKYENINDSTISFLKTHIDNLTEFLSMVYEIKHCQKQEGVHQRTILLP